MSIYTNGNLAVKYYDNSISRTKTKPYNNKAIISSKEKLFYLVSVIILAVLAGLVISGYAIISENNYKVQELKKNIIKINQENEMLELEIAELSSPDRILNIAQKDLGMTLNEDRIIVLSGN